MPFCTNCGTEVTEQERYCSNCGVKLLSLKSQDKSKLSYTKKNYTDPKKQLSGINKDKARNNQSFNFRKCALYIISSGIIILALFILGNLFFNEKPEIIAIDNPSFRPTDPDMVIIDSETGTRMVAGELILLAVEGSTYKDIEMITASIGGKVIGSMEDIHLYQVEVPGDTVNALYHAIDILEKEPQVEIVSINSVAEKLEVARRSPKDPQWIDWSEESRWGQEYINLPQAWALATGSSNVRIGIIEQGFDLEHTDLQHMKVVMGDPKYWKKKLAEYGAPFFNHGNMVAGIIGALPNNKKGIAGVLWEADYYCYITFSLLDFFNAVENANKNRVSVINLSVIFADWANGGQYDENVFKTTNGLLFYLVNKYNNILFIQGAGNNSKVPVDYMPLASLAAELDNVITVGATEKDGNRVEAYTYGDAVSVAAPGKEIWSATSRDFRSIYFPPLFDSSYGAGSGTSYATPFVTGVAGLILSVAPELSPGEVKSIIMATSQPHVFDNNQYPLGTGVVDAYAAVLMALDEEPYVGGSPVIVDDGHKKPETKQLDEAKRKEIVDFMEKATSHIFYFFPEFYDPNNDIGNDELISLLIFNGITPSSWDASDGITRFAGEDVEWAAKTIFGPEINDITHKSVGQAIWKESEQEYHLYPFGPTSFIETHVVSIAEELDGYIVDVIHLKYSVREDYDRLDETNIYDEYGNHVVVLKGDDNISEEHLRGLPLRSYFLKKTDEGSFYISHSSKHEGSY